VTLKETLVAMIGVALSYVFVTVLGQIVPNAIVSFFKEAGGAIMLVLVMVFVFTWYLKARPHERPKKYSIVVFDVLGEQVTLDGLRTEFRNHDVAWSFMKQYKQDHPAHNFAMVADMPNSTKRTIFRYI
jgi:nitrogen fixation-related uncharacterized protein